MANTCQYCSKKISISKVFCSKDCKDFYFQKVVINLPKPFIKKLYFFCDETERENEIKSFANRHNWNIDLVKQRAKELYSEYYRCS